MSQNVTFVPADQIVHEVNFTREFLELVEVDREGFSGTRARFGDDLVKGKTPDILAVVALRELGVLASGCLEDTEGDFTEHMAVIQRQSIVVAGLMCSLYELASKHREGFLEALADNTDV